MKLFAIYVGGEFPGANIEVHDVRFVVAASIEETHEELRRQWWGVPPEPFDGPERLFFVNLGGYEPGEFAERHRNVFVVAENETNAKKRGLSGVKHWIEPHRDDLYEADAAFCLEEPIGEQCLHVHVQPAATLSEPAFTCQYIPIRKAR